MSKRPTNFIPPPKWGGRRARLGFAKPLGEPGGRLTRVAPHPSAAACAPAATLPIKGRDGEWRVASRGHGANE
jgi:hypothetical protein